jgi:hypothetical protein
LDLIILSHWNASDVVLCTELLGERCTHKLPSDAEKGRGGEGAGAVSEWLCGCVRGKVCGLVEQVGHMRDACG